jgi:L-iditol 2-dehydrogenase
MKVDLKEYVNKLTKGIGVDVVLECSGSAKSVEDALDVIKKQGQYTQIGLFGKSITINFEKVCFKELKVTGSLGSRWTSWEKAIQLLENGIIKTKPLVSHVMPIDEWEKAFDMFEKKAGHKLILTPIE